MLFRSQYKGPSQSFEQSQKATLKLVSIVIRSTAIERKYRYHQPKFDDSKYKLSIVKIEM